MDKEKLYIVRTKVQGQAFYLTGLSADGNRADYSKEFSEAHLYTTEEMESVKRLHFPGLGRWVLLESERKRVNPA